jgi:hypothetical protein
MWYYPHTEWMNAFNGTKEACIYEQAETARVNLSLVVLILVDGIWGN